MQIDFRIFDSDNHYYEPRDTFRHLPKAMADRAVRIETNADGKDTILVGGKKHHFTPPTFDLVPEPGHLKEMLKGVGEGTAASFLIRSSDGQVFRYSLQPLLRLLLIACSAGSTQEIHLALGVPLIIDSLDFDCEQPRLRRHTGQSLRVIAWGNRGARNRRDSMATGSPNEETRPCLRLSAHRVATMHAPRPSCGCTQFNGETRLCRRSRTRRRNH